MVKLADDAISQPSMSGCTGNLENATRGLGIATCGKTLCMLNNKGFGMGCMEISA